MINKIRQHTILNTLVDEKCCENEICVTFDNSIEIENTIILKIDNFYNSLHLGNNTPPSIDCLIIRKCINSGYGLTLVELKNIKNSKGFDLENMKQKFNTTINDFIKKRFKEILDINYKSIKLYFISNIEIYRRDAGLKLELLINTKFRINDKFHMIEPKMPNPMITNCY